MTLERILEAAKNSMIHGHHAPHCYSAHVQGKGYVNKGQTNEERADYLRQLERSVTSEIENMNYAKGYAEPGYADPVKGVLFANWNVLPRGLDSILEHAGYKLEWSDEWSTCESCNRAVRTSENSYSWKASYVIYNECEIICHECVREDIGEYETYLLNNPDIADTLDIDWAERGFVKMNDHHYESGFHPGQNDRPKDIVKRVPKNHDFLFTIPTVGQFDVSFDCWIRPTDYDAENPAGGIEEDGWS